MTNNKNAKTTVSPSCTHVMYEQYFSSKNRKAQFSRKYHMESHKTFGYKSTSSLKTKIKYQRIYGYWYLKLPTTQITYNNLVQVSKQVINWV